MISYTLCYGEMLLTSFYPAAKHLLVFYFCKVILFRDGSSHIHQLFIQSTLTCCIAKLFHGLLCHELQGLFRTFSSIPQTFPSIYFSFAFCQGVLIGFLQLPLILSADFSYCKLFSAHFCSFSWHPSIRSAPTCDSTVSCKSIVGNKSLALFLL